MDCAIKITRSVFYDDSKYYSQVFLDEFMHNLTEKVLSCKFLLKIRNTL